MRIYIAGKISGQPYGYVRRKFEIAEAGLRARGYQVVNPTKICAEAWPWWLCMVVCLCCLMTCQAVTMLPDWRDSRGATIERRWAKRLGKRVFDYQK